MATDFKSIRAKQLEDLAGQPSAPSQEELDHSRIGFGKYRDKTPEQISENDPEYLVWAWQNVLNRPLFMSDVLYKECKAAPSKAAIPNPNIYSGQSFTRKIPAIESPYPDRKVIEDDSDEDYADPF